MPRFHHANLGVPPELLDQECRFLTEIVGYRRLDTPRDVPQALWFEANDQTQIHLSIDPDHRPAARAHTAVDVSDEYEEIEGRLISANMPFRASTFGANRLIVCKDPAGNGWELRG